ncbi:APC family permease [Salininema proteolyticum]|uniref:APC family permease n=1 Tax=Salininema proteolyticum TaxID=1607685 RepID=A0ABV8TWL5_9ACTN
MTPLRRELGLPGAIAIGLAAMIGAGAFTVWGPATAAAGSATGLLAALGIAAAVAYANADSSARLAALYPQSGGTYVYGTRRLGPFPGFLAGWAFLTGKSASAAAMALTVSTYLWPEYDKPIAVLAVLVLLAVNLLGIKKTAAAAVVFLAVTLAVLAAIVFTGWTVPGYRDNLTDTDPWGVLTAAGLIFFAFAGYARLATLGEEVKRPQWTIPRAIPIALLMTVAIYLLIAATALHVLGSRALSQSPTALAAVAAAVNPALTPIIALGAAVAATGVLLSLLAGMGRTALAMARDGWLPKAFSRVSQRFAVPWAAEAAASATAVAVIAAFDMVGAIGFSSFCVLVYYAITNASASTLDRKRITPYLGAAGCLVVAASLPPASALSGLAVLLLGVGVYALRSRSRTVAP